VRNHKWAILIFATASLAFAAEVSHTERMDFAPGGTLRLSHSNGEVTVEGWDQPTVEITTVKSAKTAAPLDRVRITTARKGNEIVVTTELPKHFELAPPFRKTDVVLDYRIKAPSSARLTIDHDHGEVHISGITGDIHAIDHMVQITVQLPELGQYAIDAKSKLGAIDSDLHGDEHRRLKFGHSFVHQASSSSQKLYLRMGFGDITILKVSRPLTPAPLVQK
jgi:hypothetical protein